MTIAPVPVEEAVPGPRPELTGESLLALYREMVRVRVVRGGGDRRLRQGSDPGLDAPVHRSGGDQGRRTVDARSRGPRLRNLPRARGGADQGSRARLDDGGVDGARDGAVQGEGRLDASLGSLGRAHLDQCDRRRPHSDGRRRRTVLPVPEDGPGRALLLRRRGLVRRRVLRGHEHGDALEGPARLRLREQRHRDLRSDVEEPGDTRHRRPGARLRDAGVDRRRQRRPRGAGSRRRGRRSARGPAGAPRSWSARPSAGSDTPRSRPEGAIRRSNVARGSGSTRSPVSARRSSSGVSRRRPSLEDLDRGIRAAIRSIREEAERAPFPAPDSIYEDIFAP